MTKVFLTIDTEISCPLSDGWESNGLAFEYDRDILGRTHDGDFGISYQMEVMHAHGWRGVFFVEGLFACAAGREPLAKIVKLIQDRGHEVQLHLHTEWLARMKRPLLSGGKTGGNMLCFSREEQVHLLRTGIDNLLACGVERVRAFRAGNLGANHDTLAALAEVGVEFDSSAYPGGSTGDVMTAGVTEVPITMFFDYGRHLRPMQICACSSAEMRGVLMSAWRKRCRAVVIVSHGFELLHRPTEPLQQAGASRLRVRRFGELCRFLGDNRDKFEPATFASLGRAVFAEAPVRSPVHRTAWRFVEQLADRL